MKSEIQKEKVDDVLISFLQNKKEAKHKIYSLGEEVQEFIDKNKEKFDTVSKSQWGQIRVIVQFYKDSYRDEILKFITKEKDKKTAKKHWEKGFDSLKSLLEKRDIEFIKLLSMMMPKVKEKDKENDK
jgi:predicted Ser/Thr protein kinase